MSVQQVKRIKKKIKKKAKSHKNLASERPSCATAGDPCRPCAAPWREVVDFWGRLRRSLRGPLEFGGAAPTADGAELPPAASTHRSRRGRRGPLNLAQTSPGGRYLLVVTTPPESHP